MIKISRRFFSKLVAFTGLSTIFGSLLAWAQIQPIKDSIDITALEAYVDTLIPPDETPGAVALGVVDRILKKSETEAAYQAMIVSGCQWLNRQARKEGFEGFSKLSEENKEKIVRIAEMSLPGSPENSFFLKTRSDSFVYYYSNPKALALLSYSGPPQPLGFLDHGLPPK